MLRVPLCVLVGDTDDVPVTLGLREEVCEHVKVDVPVGVALWLAVPVTLPV